MDLCKRAGEGRIDPRHDHLPSATCTHVMANRVRADAGSEGLPTGDEPILVVGQGVEAGMAHCPSVDVLERLAYSATSSCGPLRSWWRAVNGTAK
jgi:hypothetical protein